MRFFLGAVVGVTIGIIMMCLVSVGDDSEDWEDTDAD